MRVEIKDKKILIDGKAQLIMAGEIHYFRLDRSDWEDRIIKLKNSGCNTVSTYIPWICHETEEDDWDLTGERNERLDIGGFIDLCKEHGLMCFVRPGPFIMAEMKNEGIPHWVSKKHPELIPVTWDNRKAPNPTLDYISPKFLGEVKKWYSKIMPIIAERLCTRGGNIIGVQLDNEVGMLSWVSNSPDLTDNLLKDFRSWLINKYQEELPHKYQLTFDDMNSFMKEIRAPKEEYVLELHKDLGYYMRDRFKRYIHTLRSYAEEFGVKEVPFAVNVHGTGGGRGHTYPIGLSQLYESYSNEAGFFSGTDIYLGSLTMDNFQDLYIINALTDSVNGKEQPLSSLEFECGDGNYGSSFGGRYEVSAVDFKARMCIAQGNRMLNYYLFAGGTNYRLEKAVDDGNDRIAITGERHGFAAPVNPEGRLNYTYGPMKKSIETIMASGDKLADMTEDYDNLVYGFIPDYFMTEYHYPKSQLDAALVNNLTKNRAHSIWENYIRGILLLNYRFTAVNLQNRLPSTDKVIVLPSARYMAEEIQIALKGFLEEGGRLLLLGEVPVFDMEGRECNILSHALGIKNIIKEESRPEYYLSVYSPKGSFNTAEIRVSYGEGYELEEGRELLKIYGSDRCCAFEREVGKGKAIVIGTDYNCNLTLIKEFLNALSCSSDLSHDCEEHGIFMTTTSNGEGESYLHILNLDSFSKEFKVSLKDEDLFGGRKLKIGPKEGRLLPINVKYNWGTIVYSTAEIGSCEEDSITFRIEAEEEILLDTGKSIQIAGAFTLEEQGTFKRIKALGEDKELIITFKE